MESRMVFFVVQLDTAAGWLVGHLNDIFTPRSRERYRGKLSLLYQPLGEDWFTAEDNIFRIDIQEAVENTFEIEDAYLTFAGNCWTHVEQNAHKTVFNELELFQ